MKICSEHSVSLVLVLVQVIVTLAVAQPLAASSFAGDYSDNVAGLQVNPTPRGSSPMPVHNLALYKDYPTIHAAMDDPDRQWNDVITVDSGTYYETFVLTSPLILHGIDTGAGKPCIDGSHDPDTTLFHILPGSGPEIDNFTLLNAGLNGFHVECQGVTIRNCDVTGAVADGLLADSDPGNTAAFMLVTGCSFSGNSNGLHYRSSCQFNTIANCYFANNSNHGILFGWNCYDDQVQGCEISNNGADGIASLDGAYANTILGNHLHHNAGAGLASLNSGYNVIQNNTIYSNGAEGLRIEGDGQWSNNHDIIMGNTVHDNGNYGIWMEGADHQIYGNSFYANSPTNAFYAGDLPPATNTWCSLIPIPYTHHGMDHATQVGNYWEGATGTDRGDGILTVAHPVDSGASDLFPLADPSSDYTWPSAIAPIAWAYVGHDESDPPMKIFFAAYWSFNDPTYVKWDFGDGSPIVEGTYEASGAVKHEYKKPGSYRVILAASNPAGVSFSSWTQTVELPAVVITQGTGSLTVTMSEDGAPTAWVAPALDATDIDPDQTLTWSVSSPASQGTATVSGTGPSPTMFSYAPAADYNGMDSFRVQVADDLGRTASITINVNIDPVNDAPTNTLPPAVTGSSKEGKTLTVTPGTWNDDQDGNPPSSILLTYQWRRASDAAGTSAEDIPGATGITYTLTAGEVSQYVCVVETATDTGTPQPGMSVSSATSWTLVQAQAAPFVTTGSMTTNRSSHTATLLPSGKVLVVGGAGSSGYLASAELYDPSTETWTETNPLTTERSDHTATLLLNGKVLVAGGWNGTYLPSTQLYEPATGTWAATGVMTTGRYRHTATLLLNGKVLVTGGANYGGADAELYDPVTGTWAATGSFNIERNLHTATLLPDGKVLVAGGGGATGFLDSAELYDPATEKWVITGTLRTGRRLQTAMLLLNGKVMVTGGQSVRPPYLASTESYDPATGTWPTNAPLNAARWSQSATLLPNGNLLVAGGNGSTNYLSSTELFDPATATWTTTDPLTIGRTYHTATLLPNGKVLIAGGWNGTYLSNAELYGPVTGTAAPIVLTHPLRTLDGSFQFMFNNTPGMIFNVFGATNLAQPSASWTSLGGATEISPGWFQFADPQTTNNPQRFYRIR